MVEIISFRIQLFVSGTTVIDYSTRTINSYEKFDVVCKFYNINRIDLNVLYAYDSFEYLR